MGVDIFNINDDFFNDICFPYSDNNSNSDMILIDRVSDIYLNYSICDKGCEYEEFLIDEMKSKCNCEVKQDANKEVKEGNFKTYFASSFINSNFGAIKCYKLVFGIRGKLKNIGFWLFGLIIVSHIPIYIFYFINKTNNIIIYINNEMDNKGYKINSNKKSIIKSLSSSLNIETTNEFSEDNNKAHSLNIKRRKKNKISKSKFHKNNPPKKINKSSSNNNYKQYKELNKVEKEENKINIQRSNSNIHPRKELFKIIKLNKKNNNLMSECASNDILYQNNNNKNKKYIIKKDIPKNEVNRDQNSNENNIKDFPLILIHANNDEDNKPLKSNYILNNYNYEEAISHEERTIWRIFFIFLIDKNNLLNLIFFNPPLELKPLRICIFIFSYACDFALNAFFYLTDNISDKYHYTGKNRLLHTVINNINISLVSLIVCFILLYFFQTLTESSNNIKNLFKEQDNLLKSDKNYIVKQETILKIKGDILKIMRCLKIKINFFFLF